MITDAHTHLKEIRPDRGKELLDELNAQDLRVLASASGPEECGRILALARLEEQENSMRPGAAKRLLFSFGIHPWDADRYGVETLKPGGSMEPYLRSCHAIGEIGMDRLWCEVPLGRQKEIFLAQLELAERRGCPVVLHTKGCEMEIAEILEGYVGSGLGPVLVHWYSGGEEALERFVRLGCHFSVGPDVRSNPSVMQVVRRVPVFRLLVETDGADGVEWALGKKPAASEITGLLRASAAIIAKEKGLSLSEVLSLLEMNFQRFL